MTKTNFTTSLQIKQSRTDVYTAINNAAAWWSGEVVGKTKEINDEFTYRFEDLHYSRQKVVELIPNEKVVWLVTESKLTFLTNQEEWTGTNIVFVLSELNGGTLLTFTHEGLDTTCDCYSACSSGWTKLIHESLLSLITTGKGKIVF